MVEGSGDDGNMVPAETKDGVEKDTRSTIETGTDESHRCTPHKKLEGAKDEAPKQVKMVELKEPKIEEGPIKRRRGKGRRRLDRTAGGKIMQYFPKLVCPKEWTESKTTEGVNGLERKRKLDGGGLEGEGMEPRRASKATRTMRKTMGGNPPDRTTSSGDLTLFMGAKSSTWRETDDERKKGAANWGMFGGIIGSNGKKTPKGFGDKEEKLQIPEFLITNLSVICLTTCYILLKRDFIINKVNYLNVTAKLIVC